MVTPNDPPTTDLEVAASQRLRVEMGTVRLSIHSRATKFWQGLSLPWPEPGVRLIRRGEIATCDQQLGELQEELAESVAVLNEHYEELKDRARQRLEVLYNPEDYPTSLDDCFRLEWDFPAVEAPGYLRSLAIPWKTSRARCGSRRRRTRKRKRPQWRRRRSESHRLHKKKRGKRHSREGHRWRDWNVTKIGSC